MSLWRLFEPCRFAVGDGRGNFIRHETIWFTKDTHHGEWKLGPAEGAMEFRSPPVGLIRILAQRRPDLGVLLVHDRWLAPLPPEPCQGSPYFYTVGKVDYCNRCREPRHA